MTLWVTTANESAAVFMAGFSLSYQYHPLKRRFQHVGERVTQQQDAHDAVTWPFFVAQPGRKPPQGAGSRDNE